MTQKKEKTNRAWTTNRTSRIAFGVVVFSIMFAGLLLCYMQPRFLITDFSPPLPIIQTSFSRGGAGDRHVVSGHRNGSYVSQKRLQGNKNTGGGGASSPLDTEWCINSSRVSATMDTAVLEVQESHIVRVLKTAGLSVQRGPRMPPMRISPRTQFEQCLISSPPLRNDFRLAPDELKSKVTLVNPKPHYHTWDSVQVRADLFDGYGHPRSSGGDEVRMRVISKPGQRTAIAAEVKDLGNGSYLGTTLLPWNGTASVQVYVTYPREFLREAVRQKLTLRTSYWTTANFRSGSRKERTACLPSLPPMPGYDTVCNLTHFNGGMSLFCGRPKTGLRCEDLSHFSVLKEVTAPDTLPADRLLLKKINKKQAIRLIPNNISISIAADQEKEAQTSRQPDLPPCWKKPPRATWQSRAPRGWFDSRGVWTSLECSLPETIRAQHVQRCLRNTSVYLVGDSNLRHWYYEIQQHLNCSRQETAGSLHVHKLCEVSSTNTTLKWSFHARPTCTSPDSDNTPLQSVLADLRHQLLRHGGRRVILILHYFLHLTLYSPSVYVDRLREARRYLQDFLQEFPPRDVTVVIRGPHAIFNALGGNALTFGDLFAPFYIRAWHREFQGLKDRVRFLDFWDMTVAAQSIESHPVHWIKTETVKVLLGNICQGLR